jgi:hypothetical protein
MGLVLGLINGRSSRRQRRSCALLVASRELNATGQLIVILETLHPGACNSRATFAKAGCIVCEAS